MDGSLPGSSVHRIFQARVLECVAISFSRGTSWSKDWTQVSCIASRRFTIWATREIQFSSVAQSCPTLCDPMNHSTPGLPVHHHLPEFTQTHIHRVRDAIQPSHSRLSPSPPAPNSSQHQSLFQWVNSCMRWPKYWSFSFSIIPSKEIPRLISFRILVDLFSSWNIYLQ